MGESKAVDGVVDELLLGDGFSIVDSTKGDGGGDSDTKKKSSKTEKKPEVKKEKEKVEEKKKEEKKKEEKKKEEKKEEPPKEDTTSKDDGKVNGHDTKSDALLITTEEDLDLEKDKKSESDVKEESESKSKKDDDKDSKEDSKAADKRKQGDVWVSNITRHVKATDLKKHFSKHGKVLTAKIVTNGKSFFGYILMENSDIANKCVRSLHGSTLDGRKITVSRQRPDQRRSITERKTAVKPKTEKKPEKKTEEKKSTDTKKDDALAAAKRAEERLRREVDYHKREAARLKRFLSDEQRRLRLEQTKNRTLNRDLQEAESKLREERRKIDRERDIFEKSQRTDRVKLEADRSLIKKELEEVKKLREYLKRKLEEEARPVERRPRANSPYAYSSKRFRESSGGDKGSKYVEERTRTPPSPPKLSSRSKRSPVNSFVVEKDRRGPSHHYGMDREDVGRHGNSMVMPAKPSAPAAPRNIWPSFHQEVWRMPPSGGATSTPFGSSQSYPNRQEYGSSSSSTNKPNYSSQQRDFNKRDHYSSSSVRKY